MKKQTNQSNGHYVGHTTYALESVAEAIAIVLNSKVFEDGSLDKDARAIRDSIPDVIQEGKKINPNIRLDAGLFRSSWGNNTKEGFLTCVKAIATGHIPGYEGNLVEDAKSLAEKLRNLVVDVEPSLSLDQSWQASEQSDVWDAGAIASGEERPCFEKNKEEKQTKTGKGDGAFRLLCNTDVYWSGNPCYQAAQLTALVDILQAKAPVEFWVQQGWMGNGSDKNGVTLFPVHMGGPLDLAKVLFWIGHPGKDCPFSYIVNRALGRVSSGVSCEAELPCDLYLYGLFMPPILDPSNEESMKAATEWIAKTARRMLFDEEEPENWS